MFKLFLIFLILPPLRVFTLLMKIFLKKQSKQNKNQTKTKRKQTTNPKNSL